MAAVESTTREDLSGVEHQKDFSDDFYASLMGFEEIIPEGYVDPRKKGKAEPKKEPKKKNQRGTESAETFEETAEDYGVETEKAKNSKEQKSSRTKGKRKNEEIVAEESSPTESKEEGDHEELPAPPKRKKHIANLEAKLAKKRLRRKESRKKKKAALKGESVETKVAEGEQEGDATNKEEQPAIEEPYVVDDDPYSAWEKFYLPEPIMKALRKMKFQKPSDIQDMTLLNSVQNRLDILGAAETGSGKTLAFVVPVIARLLAAPEKVNGPKAFIIAPTRELAVQIKKVVDTLCQFTSIKASCIVGGLAEVKQLRVMEKRKPEIIVATPGRLWDLMDGTTNKCQYLTELKDVQCIVVDETDRMVEQGHFSELKSILKLIRSESKAALDNKLQTLVFSATLTYVLPANKTKEMTTQQKINFLIGELGLRVQRVVVDVTSNTSTPKRLVETRMNCDDLLDKDVNVVYLLNRYKGRTLIFTNSVDASRRLYGILGHLKMNPFILNSNMIQRQRLRNLEKFTEMKNGILLATDVAARGLDIKGIQHVIHYQVPRTVEMYIHRSGRTARASQTGLAVLMVDPKDAYLYRKICNNLQREKDLPVFPIDSPHLKRALRERVRLASEMDVLLYRAKKIRLTETWFEKMAREADLSLDDRFGEIENANGAMSALMVEQDTVKNQLYHALKAPLPAVNYMSENLKTSYITPELVAQHSRIAPEEALDGLNTMLNDMNELKKKMRKRSKLLKSSKKPSKV